MLEKANKQATGLQKIEDSQVENKLTNAKFTPVGIDLSGDFWDWDSQDKLEGVFRKQKTIFDFTDQRGDVKDLVVLEFTIYDKAVQTTKNVMVANSVLLGNFESAAKEIHEANNFELGESASSNEIVTQYFSGLPFIIAKVGEGKGKKGTYYKFSIKPANIESK